MCSEKWIGAIVNKVLYAIRRVGRVVRVGEG
jgi:hypothetical protein